MIRKPLRYFKRSAIGRWRWHRRPNGAKVVAGNSKGLICFELAENRFERYLYLLVKFFLLEGYTVSFRKNFAFFGDLEKYSQWLFDEEGVFFHDQPPGNALMTFSDRHKNKTHLSCDYFSKSAAAGPPSFYIPMAMHPYAYREGYWNENAPAASRLKSIFFAGSFDQEAYTNPLFAEKFMVLNRWEIFKRVSLLPPARLPASMEELDTALADGKIILVDRARFSIPQKELRKTLSRFDFFLACPGVSMPPAHNLVEALSAGCIPVIEKGYARLLRPAPEDQRHAFVFDRQQRPLEKVISEVLNLPAERIAAMRENVLRYYQDYFTPASVVQALLAARPRTVFLNAETFSVRLIRGKFSE